MEKLDQQSNDLASDDVITVREGMFNMWVCAPKHMTREQVQAQVNLMPPAGTEAGWQVEEETNENPQLTSPGLCAEDDSRQHWNCVC